MSKTCMNGEEELENQPGGEWELICGRRKRTETAKRRLELSHLGFSDSRAQEDDEWEK